MRLLICWLLLLPQWSLCQMYVPGQTYWSADGYIEYRCGSLPLIITAPHGGYLSPDSLPTRACPGATTVQDGFTLELAQAIDSMYGLNHACRPHVVISHLHRRKLDPNRDSSEASCNDARSMSIWRAFHGFVQAARDTVQLKFGKGILLDLHGHAHTIQRIELGYQLTGDQLRSGDSAINSAFRVQRSGIRSLVGLNLGAQTHSALLRGPQALGTLLHASGYPSVPSHQDSAPLPGEPFFSGGYITERHGSMFGGTVDAIQLEHYMTGIRNTVTNRSRYADTLRLVTNRFLTTHYFGDTLFLSGCAATPNALLDNKHHHSWFKVYPNPGNAFYIDADTAGDLYLLDMQGKKRFQQSLANGQQLISPTLPAGVYILWFKAAGKSPEWLRWINAP